jgi:hypothetical protein
LKNKVKIEVEVEVEVEVKKALTPLAITPFCISKYLFNFIMICDC